MKYIKLFEKFDSNQLSKIVGYIKKSERLKFMNDLKSICGSLDYPISNLSDDNFQYLKFYDALKLMDPQLEEKSICQYCNGTGKVKKPWGKEGQKGFHYRDIKCRTCDGTGNPIEGKTDRPPIYIKFWFNTEGKYLGITRNTETEQIVTNNFNDYTTGEEYIISEIIYKEGWDKIKRGDKITFDDLNFVFSLWIEEEDGMNYFYAIHNNNELFDDYPDECPMESGWEKYGKYSIFINEYVNFIIKLIPKTKKIDKSKETDPYKYNICIDSNLNPSSQNTKELLKDSEFSLILNIDSIKSSEFKRVSDIKKGRVESKQGALGLRSIEEIRKEKIESYISKLSSYDPTGSLNQLKVLIPRFFGWNHPSFFIYYGINFDSLMKVTNLIFNIASERNTDSIESIVSDIKSIIVNSYKETSKRYSTIVENSLKAERIAKEEKRNDIIEFIEKYKDLNRSIISYIGKDINSVADIESTERKIKVIRDILKSERYKLNDAKSFLNHLSTVDPIEKCTSYEKIKQYMDTKDKDRLLKDMTIIVNSIKSL